MCVNQSTSDIYIYIYTGVVKATPPSWPLLFVWAPFLNLFWTRSLLGVFAPGVFRRQGEGSEADHPVDGGR